MKSISRRIIRRAAPEPETAPAPPPPPPPPPVEDAPKADIAARDADDAAEVGEKVDYAAVIQKYASPEAIGNSRQKAIRAFCVQCCVGQIAEVRKCTAVRCALHAFRMGGRPGNADDLRAQGLPVPKRKPKGQQEDDSEEGEED